MTSRHPLHSSATAGCRAQRGVTLIELMIGMLIGLLAVLVISQVLLTSERQKRTTTSGADAQVTGSLAMYTLQRELQMAGYGLATSQIGLGCSIRSVRYDAANGNGSANRTLAPALITDGASGASDQLRIHAAAKESFSVPTRITSDHPTSGTGSTEFVLNNVVGIATNDLMIAVPADPVASTCAVFRATGPGSTAGKSIVHAIGDSGAWNTNLMTIFPAGGYPSGSYVVNLGAGLIDRIYKVQSGALMLDEFDNATADRRTTELFPQVVNLQAFYGKASATSNGQVVVYDTVTPATPAEWARVVTLRVALVVRSPQYEEEQVTSAAPVWDLGALPLVTGASACGSSQCLTLKVDADINATDWKHYRYKVYDTVIPLRNLIWRS